MVAFIQRWKLDNLYGILRRVSESLLGMIMIGNYVGTEADKLGKDVMDESGARVDRKRG